MVRRDSDARDEQARVRSLGISHHGGSRNARTQGHRNCLCIERVSPKNKRGTQRKVGPTIFGTRAEWRRNAGSMLFLEGELALAVEGGDSIRGVFVVEGGYQDGGPLTRWSPPRRFILGDPAQQLSGIKRKSGARSNVQIMEPALVGVKR